MTKTQQQDELSSVQQQKAAMTKTWREQMTPNTTLGDQLVLMQAEIDELRAYLGDLPEAQAELLSKVKQLTAERDALRSAAQVGLDALKGLFGVPKEHTGEGGGGVAFWRLGGSDAPRQAITQLQAALKEQA